MSIEPRFEVGVDYDGVSPRHHQLNEVRTFSNDKTDRIFFPECGAFYTEKLFIKDINTGRELIRGTDYDCMIIDSKATNNSGMEVCGVINVTNPEISGVALDYQFVGGLHMTGYYLLEQLMKMYPNGASAIVSYDDLINVPDEFDPAYHTQHVHEFFGTESLLVWIERIRQGIVQRQESNLISLYNNAQSAIDDLYATLQENVDRLKQEIQDTFDKLKIQTDEYILTDSSANPATTRGYGVWQLITDSVLYGVTGTTFLVGSGGSIAIGGEQIIRNCYIWKNIEGTTLTETNIVVTSNKDAVNEGESITFTITSTNVPNGTRYTWAISDAEAKDFTSALTGVVTINNGTASVTVTTKKDYITDGDKNHIFYIVEYARARKPFVVLDTSLTSKISSVRFVDSNNTGISAVSEDQTFKLAIDTTGMQGLTAYLKWTLTGGLLVSDFKSPLPSSVVVTGNITYVSLTTVGNLKIDGERLLKVLVTEIENEPEHSMSKTASVTVMDTSRSFEGTLTFVDAQNLLISSLDEGKDFKIRLKTNGGVGRVVKFTYQTNKELFEFNGLVDQGIVQPGNLVTIPVQHLADFVTRVEPEFLVVKAFDGTRQIAEGTLMFNDTSKTPNFQVMFSKKNDGSEPITTINEGEEFYIVFQVPGWIGATMAPVLDINYALEGRPNVAARVLRPNKTTNLTFDGNNNTVGIEWVNFNTLAIKNTAIADKAIFGDAVYSFTWKTTRSSTYSAPVKLTILDTSRPTLTATWSSSATTLTPVTSVNEMTTLGTRTLVYLWIEVDGNAASFDNLRLMLTGNSVATQQDLITIFPNNLAIAANVNKHVVTVEINNDFITEGNELLRVVAVADNTDRNVFNSTLTIVDNSVQTSLSLQASTSASNVVAPSNGLFSEWSPAYVIVTHESFSFDSVLNLSITDSGKLSSLPASIPVLANTTKTVITINPASGRNGWGNHNHTLTARRMFDGKNLTAAVNIAVNFINDKVNPTLSNVRITSDALGNANVTTELQEGATYYVHATINKPLNGLVGVIGIIDNSDTGDYGGLQRLSFANNKKVLLRSTTDGNTTLTMSTPFTIPFDRTTNPAFLKLRFAAKIDWTSSKTVGQVYDEDITVTDASSQSVVVERTLVDTSKSLLITHIRFVDVDGIGHDRFNEGDDMFIEATINQGTIGDVYNIIHDDVLSTVKLNRFSYHEFSSKDITVTTNGVQKLRWKTTILANMFTDGPATGYVKLFNKTAGTYHTYDSKYEITDSSKTPEHTATWLSGTSGTTVVSSVNEGATFRLQVKTLNLPVGSQVKLTHVSGRPLSDFETHEIDTTKTLTASGSNLTAEFTFTLSNNAKTDTVNNLVVKYEVVQHPTITANASINIVDTSQTRSFGTAEWRANSATGAIITSVNEGATAVLVVKAAGGSQSLGVRVENDGGRSTDRLDAHEYNVTKTRTSDDQILTWTFTPKTDNATNSGVDLNLKVKLFYVDDPTVTRTMTLPINDTSRSAGYSARFSGEANGNNTITSANEGTSIYLVFDTENVPTGVSYAWNLNGTTSANGKEFFSVTSGTFTTNSSGRAVVKIDILNDELTNSSKTITATVKEGTTSRSTTSTFTVNDTSKTPTYAVGFATNTTGTTTATSVNEGSTVYAVLRTTNVADGTVFTYALTGTGINVNDTTVALTGNITVNNNIGYITVTPKADTATEGNETLTITVKLGTTTVDTANITINDTSKTAGYEAVMTSNSAGTSVITSANEGSVVYLTFNTTNVPTGQTFTWEITSTTSFNGLTGYAPLSGSFTTNASGKAVAAITINKDELTQNNKRLSIAVKSGTTVQASVTDFVINDVSKTPTIDNVYWSTRQDGSDSITSVTNGQVFYLIVKSSNIEQTSAKEFSLTFGGTAASTDFTTDVISGTRTIDIGTYTPATGVGHTWYMLQVVVEDPNADYLAAVAEGKAPATLDEAWYWYDWTPNSSGYSYFLNIGTEYAGRSLRVEGYLEAVSEYEGTKHTSGKHVFKVFNNGWLAIDANLIHVWAFADIYESWAIVVFDTDAATGGNRISRVEWEANY